MRSILTAHDVERLKAMYLELPGLSWKAANRLRIFPPAQALEGEDLRRFQEAHAELKDIVAKMASILGDD
jgi:hypothetical protein